MNNQERIINLFNKYTSNQATLIEVEELLNYIRSNREDDFVAQLIEQSMFNHPELEQDLDREKRLAETHNVLLAHINSQYPKPTKKLHLWRYVAVASSILFISLFGTYIYRLRHTTSDTASVIEKASQIAPGSNRAILTLADGSVINLDNANNGEIAKQANINISKTTDGQLIYTIANTSKENTSPGYNTVNTPNGGQYRLTLPDGTKVWLNAASALKYPASFNAQRERRIELNGEAYFEVAKDKAHPFIVKTATQEVKVLGTHFNINSYKNEPQTVTTLAEGRVEITTGTQGLALSPGEKMITKSSGNMEVQIADVETALAWKNGQIKFKDADIQTIMRQVSRWYNIEVSYEGNIPRRSFNGGLSRQSNLATLLKLLQLSNINFDIQQQSGGGSKLIVKP